MAGYRFINAAVNYQSFAGMGIYIRYKSSHKTRITVKRFDPSTVWLQCPDREIWMVKDHHKEHCEIPWSEGFDEYVDLNLWNSHVSRAFGTDFIMTNFLYTEKTFCPDNRTKGHPGGDHPLVQTDSGGFQMINQLVDYIDPLKLVDHYNRNSDIGIVLDIPTLGEGGDKQLMRSALIQKKNTQIMMENKRKDLRLMNVMHGHDVESFRRFREVVERPDIKHVSMGGAPDTTLVTSTDQLAEFVLTGQKYEQYHALGIYNPSSMLPLARLANIPSVTGLVTSDASTALMSANNKMYHMQQEQFGPPRRILIGDKNNVPSTRSLLTCGCPVCKTIKYTDIFSVLDSGMIRHMLFLHNVFEIQRFSNLVDDMARTTSIAEYKEFCRGVHANAKDRIKGALAAIDYVQEIEEQGLESARARFRINLIKKPIWDISSDSGKAGMNSTLYESYTELEALEEASKKDSSSKSSGISINTSDEYVDAKVYLFRILDKYENPEKRDGKKVKGKKRMKGGQRYSKSVKTGIKANSKKIASVKSQAKKIKASKDFHAERNKGREERLKEKLRKKEEIMKRRANKDKGVRHGHSPEQARKRKNGNP